MSWPWSSNSVSGASWRSSAGESAVARGPKSPPRIAGQRVEQPLPRCPARLAQVELSAPMHRQLAPASASTASASAGAATAQLLAQAASWPADPPQRAPATTDPRAHGRAAPAIVSVRPSEQISHRKAAIGQLARRSRASSSSAAQRAAAVPAASSWSTLREACERHAPVTAPRAGPRVAVRQAAPSCQRLECAVLHRSHPRVPPGETRVAATPATVGQLIGLGYDVVVEAGAGAAPASPTRRTPRPAPQLGDQAWAADIVFKVNAPSTRGDRPAARRRDAGQPAQPGAEPGAGRRARGRVRSPRWRWTRCRASRARSRWTC